MLRCYSYLGFSSQAADLDGRGWQWDRDWGSVTECLSRTGEEGWCSRDRCGDDNASQWGGASLAARLPVDNAHLMDGSCRGK